MEKNKLEDFIKANSKKIYEEDLIILNDDNKFEQLLNKEFKIKKVSKRPIHHITYWLSAAVLIIGAILFSHLYTDKNTTGNTDNVEDYLVSVNNKIDSLIEKVEAIDPGEHTMLITDLRQLKKDNATFIESTKTIESETIIIDIKQIKDQQMIMLSNLEENLKAHFIATK